MAQKEDLFERLSSLTAEFMREASTTDDVQIRSIAGSLAGIQCAINEGIAPQVSIAIAHHLSSQPPEPVQV